MLCQPPHTQPWKEMYQAIHSTEYKKAHNQKRGPDPGLLLTGFSADKVVPLPISQVPKISLNLDMLGSSPRIDLSGACSVESM